jgi:hypothetical protein
MLIVAVFSIVIFYWAMATKLPREEMLNLVARQSSENPEDNLPPPPPPPPPPPLPPRH